MFAAAAVSESPGDAWGMRAQGVDKGATSGMRQGWGKDEERECAVGNGGRVTTVQTGQRNPVHGQAAIVGHESTLFVIFCDEIFSKNLKPPNAPSIITDQH